MVIENEPELKPFLDAIAQDAINNPDKLQNLNEVWGEEMDDLLKDINIDERNVMNYKVLNSNRLGSLLFGQQHVTTQFYFKKNTDQCHTIYLTDFPHYKFLQNNINDPFSDNPYNDYLKYSWEYYSIPNTVEKRNKKTQSYIELFENIKSKRNLNENAIEKPIRVCIRPDGEIVIIDGNHRASIAYFLGLDIKAEFISLPEQLKDVVYVPDEFFGTKRFGKPYQSIFYKNKMLVEGRRCDVYNRMGKVRIEDIKGKTVLDLGCNIGMSSFLSAEKGASSVLGVEYSPRIATGAIRLNTYFTYPCDFIQWDLNKELKDTIVFDTVFCFSVLGHLKSHENILKTLKRTIGSVLYFEGHAGTTQNTYNWLLNSNNFRKIEQLAFSDNGIHSNESTRPFFRCER